MALSGVRQFVAHIGEELRLVAVEALAINKKLALKADVAPDLPRGRGDERRRHKCCSI